MMSYVSQSVYASTPFKFVVDGNPYYIHADLVSLYSYPLDRMINGQMAEALKGFAVLEDVDQGTFKRFMEWLYKGYYKAADFQLEAIRPPFPVPSNKEEGDMTGRSESATDDIPTAEELAQEVPVEEPPVEEPPAEDWPAEDWRPVKNRGKSKMGRKSKTGQELKESFVRREYTVRRQVICIPPARANFAEDEDYTEVFLSHARVYVFADKYDIQPLKTLAFEELHNSLAIYTLHRRRTGDIIALLRYVYANTSATTSGGEDLRTLLRDYIGYEMSVLMRDEGFKDLMLEEGGALLGDFMRMVRKRIT